MFTQVRTALAPALLHAVVARRHLVVILEWLLFLQAGLAMALNQSWLFLLAVPPYRPTSSSHPQAKCRLCRMFHLRLRLACPPLSKLKAIDATLHLSSWVGLGLAHAVLRVMKHPSLFPAVLVMNRLAVRVHRGVSARRNSYQAAMTQETVAHLPVATDVDVIIPRLIRLKIVTAALVEGVIAVGIIPTLVLGVGHQGITVLAATTVLLLVHGVDVIPERVH